MCSGGCYHVEQNCHVRHCQVDNDGKDTVSYPIELQFMNRATGVESCSTTGCQPPLGSLLREPLKFGLGSEALRVRPSNINPTTLMFFDAVEATSRDVHLL